MVFRPSARSSSRIRACAERSALAGPTPARLGWWRLSNPYRPMVTPVTVCAVKVCVSVRGGV